MTKKEELKNKLEKIFLLYNDKGATEGERTAAAIAYKKIQRRLQCIEVYQFNNFGESK